MLIDIHTHAAKGANHLEFVVGKHSRGIHPWLLRENMSLEECLMQFDELKASTRQHFLAVGECGLDRRRKGIASIEIQTEVLRRHIDWAIEINRPLIFHCVHAEADLLRILKEKKYSGVFLIHDYSANAETLKAFSRYQSYFSFGARLFSPHEKIKKVINSLSMTQIFFETDDQDKYSIEEIYKKGSQLLNYDLNIVEDQLEKNLKNFFLNFYDISSSNIINDLSGSSSF